MQAVFETLFDIVYLVSVITLGVLMIRGSRGHGQYFLYGMMAIVLGCGGWRFCVLCCASCRKMDGFVQTHRFHGGSIGISHLQSLVF